MFIKIENMNKSYLFKSEISNVFSDLNLSIQQGEFIALTGKSGCGKSTLLRIIGCLESFDSGKYFFNGKDISLQTNSALSKIRNKKIGFVYQNFNLIPEYTIFENIEVPLGYAGVSYRKRKERINSLLENVGLLHKANSYPDQLSGGQQQRVAIARALANEPLLLLADEPTGNLDADNMEIAMNLFKTLNEQGLTIIMVTHDEKSASYADKILKFSEISKQEGI